MRDRLVFLLVVVLLVLSAPAYATIYPQFEIKSGDYNTLTIKTDGGSEASFQCGLGTTSKVHLAVDDSQSDCENVFTEYKACLTEKETLDRNLAVCKNRKEPSENGTCAEAVTASLNEQRKALEASYHRELATEKQHSASLQETNRTLMAIIPTIIILFIVAFITVIYFIQKAKPEVQKNGEKAEVKNVP